jgi:hypothetical protein
MNPIFEPPPLHICHQQERTKESVEIREIEEERLEEREGEDTIEGEAEVSDTSQEEHQYKQQLIFSQEDIVLD